MLIYIKQSENRHERLDGLLDRIRDDDRVSYVAFDSADELETLVTDDLATLLAERFDDARRGREPAVLPAELATSEVIAPPMPLTRMIGRDNELRRCVELLTNGCRLLTITGPGGVGKTRLGVAVTREVGSSFPDGVAFVDLAPLRDAGLVVPAIAVALGIPDTGDIPLRTRVAHALDHRRVLLVLDNVEHVVDAAGDLSALLDGTAVVVLATSRTLLRIEGEQALTVTSLSTPAAVELFVDRARAVKPDFELTDSNADDVAAITTAMDNLPLAVELAAARVRVLPPAAMVNRLDHALALLVGGARNHPDRQRTLRATIAWSAELLADAERELLHRLGVFRGHFALDAVEWMCEGLAAGPADEVKALDLLTALVDSSLVQEQEDGSLPVFSMLDTVRQYAREELELGGRLVASSQRHADFYADLAVRAEPELIGAEQSVWMDRLGDEFEDLRAAVEHYLDTQQGDAVMGIVWPLYWFWWGSGRVTDFFVWVSAVAEASYQLEERTRRRAEFFRAAGRVWLRPDTSRIPELKAMVEYFARTDDFFTEMFVRNAIALTSLQLTPPDTDEAERHLGRAQELAEQHGSQFHLAMVRLLLGQSAIMRGAFAEAVELTDASLLAALASGDALSQSGALSQMAWIRLYTGDTSAAREYLIRHLRISVRVRHEEGIALALEGMSAAAAADGDARGAGRYIGAADAIRMRMGAYVGPTVFSNYEQFLAQLEAPPAGAEFEAARQEGREAGTATIVAEVLSEV